MDRYESYSQAPIFTSLAAVEIADLLDGSVEIDAEPGDVLLAQGELGRGLFLVASGRFAVRREGLAEPLALLGDLAHFGDVSLITNEPASASVVCEEAGRVRLLARDQFSSRLRQRDPAALMVALNIARVLARRIVRSEDRLLIAMLHAD